MPERAPWQRNSAPTPLTANQAAFPHKNDFAHVAHTRQRTEQPLDKRRAGPAGTTDVHDPDRLSVPRRLVIGPRHLTPPCLSNLAYGLLHLIRNALLNQVADATTDRRSHELLALIFRGRHPKK
jgi:hypothetical protein